MISNTLPRRGCPAPAPAQFPGSRFPCPLKAGCGSTVTEAEAPWLLGPCASSIWPPRSATFVWPMYLALHPRDKRPRIIIIICLFFF